MQSLSLSSQILVSKGSGIGHLVLNQPEKFNAISYEMWQGIRTVVEDYSHDDDVRVIVVSGAGGKAFSAGADISQFEKQRGTKEALENYNTKVKAAYAALSTAEKPTVAKIDGYCFGGGLAMALCCDLRIASEGATFSIPVAKLGLGYGYDVLRTLVDLVGAAYAKEILYTARRFSAGEAYDMGLVNRVVPQESLEEYVNGYVENIAGNAPLTIRAAKIVIGEILKDPESRDLEMCNRLIDTCYESDDYKEGRQAFMEKRKPLFKAR